MALTATPKRLCQGQFNSSMTSIITNSGGKNIIKNIMLCNTSTTTTEYFSLAIVPDSVILGDEHYVFKDVELAAKETKVFDNVSIIIEIDDKIYGMSTTADTVSYYISSAEFTTIT